MPTLSPQSQTVIADFGRQPGVTPDQVNNLQQVLSDSPVLMDQFNEAVARGHLRQIVPLTNPHAGGEYDGPNKVMRLSLPGLTTGRFTPGEATFVLGHELQHGFNHAATQQANQDLAAQATAVARSPSTVHDYTAVIGNRLAANRRDEASAEIGGWNAVVSRVGSINPSPTLADIYKETGRARDFIDFNPASGFSLKPNLTAQPDFTLSPTPSNVEAMGRNYFDKAPAASRLGHHGSSDYANYYAASAISYTAQLERHYNPPRHGVETPKMTVDMASLRLSEKLLEENGISLGRHPNPAPMPYHDSSTTPSSLHHFEHTSTTHAHVPITAPALGAAANQPERRDATDMRDPAHPGHRGYQHALDSVHRYEHAQGIASGSHSETLAAALATMGEREKFNLHHLEKRVDGQLVAVQQGPYHTDPERRIAVDARMALSRSMGQYSTQLAAMRSPHYGSDAPTAERTREQAQALAQLSPADQQMFTRIRGEVPGHISDDVVAHALLAAKKEGIDRMDKIGGVAMTGDRLLVMGTTPGFHATVNVSAPVPSAQESVQQTQAVNQQQVLAQQEQELQRQQQVQSRPAMTM